MNTVFKDFMRKFDHFLGPCEEGFRNELIIQMFTASFQPNVEIVYCGQRFNRLYFALDGKIDLVTHHDKIKFLQMSPGAVIGDYCLIFDLKSNITWKTPDLLLDSWEHDAYTEESMTNFMCCNKSTFIDLCELYPRTCRALRDLAIEKRDIIQFFY